MIFMVASTAMLIAGPVSSDKGGTEKTFSYHPLFMSIGFSFFVTVGFWMFNYEDLPGGWIDTRWARRRLHATFQSTGILFVLLGYGAVVRAHLQTPGAKLFQVTNGKDWSFSEGPDWARMIHIVLGYSVLGLCLMQFFIGMLKFRALADEDDSDDQNFSIHETIGNMTYSCGMLNIMLGVWMWGAWPVPVRAAISLAIITSAAFGPRWDGTRGFLSDSADDADTATKSRGGGIGRASS